MFDWRIPFLKFGELMTRIGGGIIEQNIENKTHRIMIKGKRITFTVEGDFDVTFEEPKKGEVNAK